MAADAVVGAGEPNRGLSILDQVLAETDLDLDVTRRAELVERRAFMLRALSRDREAVRQLQDALTLLPAGEATPTRAVVLASLANSRMRTDDMEGAASTAREAVAVAARVGAVAQQADALITLGSVLAYLDDGRGDLAALREGVELAERHGLHTVSVRGYTNLSDVLAMLGRFAEAAEVARAGVALAGRVGLASSWGAMITGNLAEPLVRLGRWREALDLITESLADEPSGAFASTLLLMRAEICVWQGDEEGAKRDLREARRHFGDGSELQFVAPMRYLEAELARSRGRLTEARYPLRGLGGPIAGVYARYVWPLLWLGMRVEADIADSSPSGDSDTARERDRLFALVREVPNTTPSTHGYAAMVEAEAARLARRDEVAAWQRAVDATRVAAEAYPLCYSLFRLAEAQATDPAVSADHTSATAAECMLLAERLAAATADDIRTLARRARLRIAPAPAESAATHPSLRIRLTDRELEVLDLVADGHSNGQIAAALYISPKTASVHVSNILAKLNVSSRTEAAVQAHRLGLLTTSGS
jgi:DNA-binding CsgD family transcriptional regulator